MQVIKRALILIFIATILGLAGCDQDGQTPTDKEESIKPVVTSLDPSSGIPGDVITILGQNLYGDEPGKVILTSNGRYPDIEAEIVVKENNTIKFKVPADPIYGSQSVIVRRGDSTANARPLLRVGSKFWRYSQATATNAVGGGTIYLTFSINGIGYFVGRGASFKSYDPSSNTVTVPTIPSSIGQLTAFAVGTKGYVVSDNNPGRLEVWEFNPTGGTWTKKNGSIQKGPFFKGFVFVINGKAYIGGGSDKTFVSYDPATDQFVKLADYPGINGDGAAALVVNGLGYTIGGGSSTSIFNGSSYPTSSNPNKNWKYDPSTNQWTQIANGPGSQGDRSFTIAMAVGDLIYNGAGYARSGAAPSEGSSMYVYSTISNTWTLHSFAPTEGFQTSGFYVGNTAYYVDGGGSFWYTFKPSGF